ncbi:ADP-ribosylarginine hydrolase isoform X2 [Hippocampus comes]|uniref:ADP-ribosylarginine hydrolase isoform X2 n=1 Tax=Hippocampus comes TaxID=109280 RepID=UPI00094E20A1|nr:PREDICTED: ADP-ribosylarginine hydrolase isoform X2 [Hippocampus comes]
MDRTVTVEHYKAAMLLSGAGDALGYRNQQWEYNESGAAIHKELGGLKNIKAELPDWPVSDDTVLHLATAEGLATGKEGEELLHEVAARYVEGMKDMEGRKPGPSSIHGVSQLRPGEEGGYRVAYNPEGTGCGAAMRSMCIGLRDSEIDQSQHSDASASLGAESERDAQPPEELEDAEETGDAKAIGELKGYLHNCEKFYIFSKFLKSEGEGKKKVHTGSAKCMQPGCKNKGVTYTSISRAHLRAHYQTVHPGKKSALTAALAGNSKRGQRTKHPSKKRRLPAEESRGETFSQEQARQMFTRWFVETLSPPSLCEHPYTRELFAYLNPEFQLMSRRTLARDLDELMEKAKLEVNQLLSKQQWLATTADSWTVHHRAFLGMTVHWIDRLSLKRKKATLACRELKVGQTHQLLGEAIHEVHREFGIVEKVVATTTDNGANYVAASNAFGESEERGEVQEEEEGEEEEEEEVTGQPGDVQGQLDDEDIDAEPQINLPPHRCCSAHTLNLMATTDIREVKGWSKGDTPWRRASTKARRLWNLQNRSPTAASQIKEAVKRKLTTPVAVRWNSYLNSVKVLLEVMSLPEQVEAINNIIIHHNAGVALQDQDIKVLTEYRDVMNPVADTLDSLQGEDNAYMGILLPTLLVLKRWLLQHQQRGELQYAEPLVQALLRGFDKRFGFLFEDQDLLMACALHPSFTPAVLTRIVSSQADAIKGRILRELKAMVRPGEEEQQEQQPIQAQSDVKSHQDMVFKELFGTDQEVMSQDVDLVLRASMQDWKPRREALSWALFPKEHREAWVDLFIKYNTPLPSSAAVERMFCIAGDILRRKRAALASHNFQKLVFLKGNMSLLGYPSYQGQFGGGEVEGEAVVL